MFKQLKRVKSGKAVSYTATRGRSRVAILVGYQSLTVILEEYQSPKANVKKIGRRLFRFPPTQNDFWKQAAVLSLPVEYLGLLEEAIRGNVWYFMDAMEENGAPEVVMAFFSQAEMAMA